MLSMETIRRRLGPVGTSLAVEIGQTGATEDELREALDWLSNDEALINEMRPFPSGCTAQLVELLRSTELPHDERE